MILIMCGHDVPVSLFSAICKKRNGPETKSPLVYTNGLSNIALAAGYTWPALLLYDQFIRHAGLDTLHVLYFLVHVVHRV